VVKTGEPFLKRADSYHKQCLTQAFDIAFTVDWAMVSSLLGATSLSVSKRKRLAEEPAFEVFNGLPIRLQIICTSMT